MNLSLKKSGTIRRSGDEKWELAGDRRTVRMTKRTPRMEIGGQARSRQPQGLQDGLVLETVGSY